MSHNLLLERRDRTHALVEGALLTDIAIVFLLMRAYLPILFVRPVLLAIATVPIVMLVQRRGVKITILAAIAAFFLFSALVGPLLAFAVINASVAGILIGVGRNIGLHVAINVLFTGVTFAIVDLVIPTIAGIFIFRYPIHDLVKSAQNFVSAIFRFLRYVLAQAHAPHAAIHQLQVWERPVLLHWQYAWLGLIVVDGITTMYLAVLVAEIVLNRMPAYAVARQRAAK
ncbi:MAG: hypothetical protein NVS2B16_11120 [Chloroflexota bacterium]